MSLLDVLRLAVGLPAVLLLPGLAWSYVAFPRHRRLAAGEATAGSLDVLERGAVALAGSVALVSLGALAWNGALRLPLGPGGSVALVGVLTACGAGLAAWRRRRLRTGPAPPAPPAPR